MHHWHFRNLDTLATVSARLAHLTSLNAADRQQFLATARLANDFKDQPHALSSPIVHEVFGQLCLACQTAALHDCPAGGRTLERCLLLQQHS